MHRITNRSIKIQKKHPSERIFNKNHTLNTNYTYIMEYFTEREYT